MNEHLHTPPEPTEEEILRADVRRLEAENARLREVLDDIAVSFNINEFSDGKPIDPGHKRCVEMAVKSLSEFPLPE